MVLSIFQRFLDWLKALFFKEEMELSLVGLQYSGKTTFVNVIASGSYTEDTIPTVGFNMRKVQKGNVSIKIWDIGGQPRFRTMWERYCRGVNVIVYMVDAADHDKIEQTIASFTSFSTSLHSRECPCLCWEIKTTFLTPLTSTV